MSCQSCVVYTTFVGNSVLSFTTSEREHFCRTWREDLCHFAPVRFLFAFFSEPRKIRRPLQLSLTPTPTLHSGSVSTWSAAVSTGPVSFTALRRPDNRRPGRKGGVSILLFVSHQSKAKAGRRRLSSGGFRSVADFVHGKIGGMHVRSTASSSTFEVFPRTRAFFFYFTGAFPHFGQPGFHFLLVRSSFFVGKVFVWFVMTVFYSIFVFSLCLFCLPRNAFTL